MENSIPRRSRILGIDCSPMMCAEQTRFIVLVAHGTQIPAHDLEVGALPNIVLGHFEHSEVEVSDRAEGPAGNENDGLL